LIKKKKKSKNQKNPSSGSCWQTEVVTVLKGLIQSWPQH